MQRAHHIEFHSSLFQTEINNETLAELNTTFTVTVGYVLDWIMFRSLFSLVSVMNLHVHVLYSGTS